LAAANDLRLASEAMRDYVVRVREKHVPEVKNLDGASIQNGSQTLVMWKIGRWQRIEES